jgi:site-specific DNA-methyltransferase (adenine-specific)
MKDAGWVLRSEVIWHKPNVLPNSQRDRPTTDHETIFLFTLEWSGYYFDAESIRERAVQAGRRRADRFGGRKYGEGVKHSDGSVFTGSDTRMCRTVWSIPTQPFRGSHYAPMPVALAERCILAGCPKGGIVLDPFAGTGTVGVAANKVGRRAILVEMDSESVALARERLKGETRVGL